MSVYKSQGRTWAEAAASPTTVQDLKAALLQARVVNAGLLVHTEHVRPPIPTRQYDWAAWDDRTYDGPGCPVGTGPTEEAAIIDLLEQVEG